MVQRRLAYSCSLPLTVISIFCAALSAPAIGATFTVTQTQDTAFGPCDANCSLREAVLAANRNSGADTIILPAGTYVLTLIGANEQQGALGDLDILDDVTMHGAGIDETIIDANGTDRVIHVHPAATLQLTGVTLQNGAVSGNSTEDSTFTSGGGIHNSGSLIMDSCLMRGNSAITLEDIGGIVERRPSHGGGIYTSGTAVLDNCMITSNMSGIYNANLLSLTNCTVSGNGSSPSIVYTPLGGIENEGTATLDTCLVRGNSGGGLTNGGNATLRNCTVSDNSRRFAGGGIYNSGRAALRYCTISNNSVPAGAFVSGGGGIYNEIRSTLQLDNCTLSGNVAGATTTSLGGAIHNKGTMLLTSCTVSGNSAGFRQGAGIFNNSVATISNTVVANAVPQCDVFGCNNGFACAGSPMSSNGYNLDDDGSCGFSANGDLSGVAIPVAPLGEYGGPTQTIALCSAMGVPHASCTAASPAIDAVDLVSCPAIDQRGAPRPAGSACDIGAYENGAEVPAVFPTEVVPTEAPASTATPTKTPAACIGDCNHNGVVAVNELVQGVNIALERAGLDECGAFNCNGLGVTVDCLVGGVNAALRGCDA